MNRSRLQWCAVFVLVFAAVALTACSGGGGGGGGISVTASEFKFDPANATAKAGSATTVTLRNTGTQIHDWTIDNLGGSKVQVIAQPGQSANVTFTPSQAGTYQVYCDQPGHKDAGMVGQLTVQ